ncbi:hypothetical protein FRC02_004525 [Tulasnella sp. 418]|nr:hypothetical protein FRC02_004525 [Tulasnella sp. 418]
MYHARVIEKFGMCRYWVACEQATSVLLLIELLAKLLKIPTSTSSDRFSDVVTFLESSNVLIVFLFDNFETPWDIERQRSDVGYVLARLASIPTVSIIITMRGNQCPYEESIDWSHPRLPSLTPLDLGAAEKAFTRISSKSAGNAELHTLLRELDCVPLAITLMAKLASGGESVHELVLQWRTERTRLLGQTGGDRCTCIEVSIKLSIDSQAVKANQGAIILLGILAMLPGGAAVSRLPDMCPSIPGWKAALRVLLKAALVYHNSDKSFIHVLSPIRSYVMLHHPLGEVALADLRASYCKLAGKGASEPGDPDFLTNAKQLAIEETNIDAILLEGLQGQEGDISSAISASLNYSEYLYWTQPRTNIMEAATKVAKITQNTKLGDCLKLLGRIQQLQTHYDAAKTTLKEAQAEYYRIGDRLGAAHCLKSQGQILQLQTQYDAAQDALKEAQIEYVGLGNRLGAAHCLKSRGQILQIQTQYDAARETLKEAQAEYVSLGDHLGAANCLFSLGEIFQTQKQHDEAQEALKSAQDKYTSLGDHLGVANCLRSLGQILQSQGQYDAAQAALKEAHTEYVGLGNHLGAAHTLKSLSQVLRTQKLYDVAQTALKDAQAEYASLGNRLGEANCLKSLGVIHEEQSHYDASFNALKEAHAIYSALNNRLGMANCLSKMGRISRIQSRFTDACKQLEEARVLYSAAGQAKWAQWCTKQSYLASRKRNAA